MADQLARVSAVCVVAQLRADAGPVGVTAIDKRPVAGAVRVGPYGLRADVQADRRHHGGLDKAVYVYGQEDADFWAAELGRELPPGWFGENLRVEGVDVRGVAAGERWIVGDADARQRGAALVLEATGPRRPCATFARWVGGAQAQGWVRRFSEAGRYGAYFRVLAPGEVREGDAVRRVPAPAGSPTLASLF